MKEKTARKLFNISWKCFKEVKITTIVVKGTLDVDGNPQILFDEDIGMTILKQMEEQGISTGDNVKITIEKI